MFRKIKIFYLSAKSLLIGMKVTMINLFKPAVTLQYPSEKQPMKANFRGMVDLIPKDCVICYQCIRICPTAALILGHKNIVVQEKKPDATVVDKKAKEITRFTFNAELCCYCGLCEEICPTDAIYLNKMYEVSVYKHDDILNINLMDPQKYNHINPNYVNPVLSKKDSKPMALNIDQKPERVIVLEPDPTSPVLETPKAATAVATAPAPIAPTATEDKNPSTTPNPNP